MGYIDYFIYCIYEGCTYGYELAGLSSYAFTDVSTYYDSLYVSYVS